MADLFSDSEPERLARLMALDEDGRPDWSDAELSAMMQHQLAAGLRSDFEQTGTRLPPDAGTGRAPIETFGDLLLHPSPPLPLLEAAKHFAKAARARPEGPLPVPIAAVLYHAVILVARLRHQDRITSMPEAQIRDSIRWCLEQPWLDDALRRIFLEGQQRLEPATAQDGDGGQGASA